LDLFILKGLRGRFVDLRILKDLGSGLGTVAKVRAEISTKNLTPKDSEASGGGFVREAADWDR